MWRFWKQRFELSDVLLIGFYGVLLVSLALLWGDPRVSPNLMIAATCFIVVTTLNALFVAPRSHPAGACLRTLILFFSAGVGYECVGVLLELVITADYSTTMLAVDEALFGGHPSRWAQALHHPVLTEYLQIAYLLYYFVPMVLALWLLLVKKWDAILIVVLGITLALHGNQLLYMLVPVRSPFILAADPETAHLIHYDFELFGVWKAAEIRETLLDATSIRHDCFPSGHTMMTMTVLLLAWRLHRPAFVWFLPVTLSIVFSTIYLRYHYLIDVIAGIVGSFGIAWIVPELFARWRDQTVPDNVRPMIGSRRASRSPSSA